jgi:predicted ATPase/DNA-binding winged helix-turn-helix (wHTH) protein
MRDRIGRDAAEIVYRFGPFSLFPRRQLLLRNDRPVKLGGPAFALLHLLVQRQGELVSKDELLVSAWGQAAVHDANLKVNIFSLRRALGDTQTPPDYIATIPRRGYRFVAPVTVGAADLATPPVDESSRQPCSLPPQGDVVGREADIQRVLDMLPEDRQVTLVGPGGVGKTTVAIAVAHAMQAGCPDGACMIDLSALEDPMLVPGTVARVLGLRGDPVDTLTAIVDYVRPRRMLIVLDSCEHVLAIAGLLAQKLAAAGGESRLLATSREPFGTTTERVVRLDPLGCPPEGTVLSVARARSFPAVELFARRAAEWCGYSLIEADCAAVALICRSLDGLPLAIELAAGSLERYSPRELRALLDEHLSVLSQRAQGAPPRHQTLLATIDWSYRLLSDDESTLFRRISLFADDFALADVVTIAAAATLDGTAIAVGLGGLVAKSLLVAEATGTELHYRLLDSTRRFAADRLREDPLEAMAQYAFALRILSLFEQAAREWDWRDADDWTSRYRPRLSDLRKALMWAFGPATQIWLGIRLTVAAIPLWFEMSAISEARMRVELAIQKAQMISCDLVSQMKLAGFRAWSMSHAHRLLPETEQAWLTASEFARRAGHVDDQLRGLVGLASYLIHTGHLGEALKRLEQFGTLAERHREWTAAPEAERLRALAKAYSGDLAAGREILERLATAYPRVDRRSRMAGFQVDRFVGVRCYLPFVAWLNGQRDYAPRMAHEAVEAAGKLGHLLSQSNALALAAIPIAHWNGDTRALESYTKQLQANLQIESIPLWSPVARFYEAVVRDLGGERAAARDMRKSIEQLIESRFVARIGLYLGILAETLLNQNRVSEADEVINRALQYQARQNERWCRPELQRIQAAILRHTGDTSEARSLLYRALTEAHAMQASSFELRIAFDLATAHLEAGRHAEAIGVLGPVYDSFSEGFTTQDLITASQLLSRARTL